ncbi:MAG: RNA 2'-phosphotransferase, partial [Candidatus Zixiibacteriota bacterium]
MMKKEKRRVSISKFMALVLRHSPERFGLKLDSRGFVPLDKLLKVLQNRFSKIELVDIQKIGDASSKERFEIKGNKIRARYGHSIK